MEVLFRVPNLEHRLHLWEETIPTLLAEVETSVEHEAIDTRL